ncbi:MAG TPA: hypothetical protein VMN57_13125 [Anaerolineales bacterium]|nr:hypothetical protein [Anaerolineales bacterium]
MLKKSFFAIIALTALLASGYTVLKARAAGAEIEFLNISPGQVLVLEVGESYTFETSVSADEVFLSALMLSDEQFPGRGVFLNGSDIATQTDSALLTLTATGKASTAELPGGVAPVALQVGVRYPGGIVFGERVDFFIQVP